MRATCARSTSAGGGRPIVRVAELETDVHDLTLLAQLGDVLMSGRCLAGWASPVTLASAAARSCPNWRTPSARRRGGAAPAPLARASTPRSACCLAAAWRRRWARMRSAACSALPGRFAARSARSALSALISAFAGAGRFGFRGHACRVARLPGGVPSSEPAPDAPRSPRPPCDAASATTTLAIDDADRHALEAEVLAELVRDEALIREVHRVGRAREDDEHRRRASRPA